MKQTNITLQSSDNTNLVANFVNSNLTGIANLYSELLGETVTVNQTKHLLNAQLAFLAIVLPAGPLVVNALGVAWFALALKGCKKAGL